MENKNTHFTPFQLHFVIATAISMQSKKVSYFVCPQAWQYVC